MAKNEGFMGSGRDLLKRLLSRTTTASFRHWLRRYYLSRVVARRSYRPEREIEVLKWLLSPGDFVADIGANIGTYAMELASLVGTRGQVFCFEPVAENYDILTTVIRRARLPNIQSFYVALGSRVGKVEMVIPDFGGFMGFYLAHIARSGERGRRELVDVMALDTLWRDKTISRLHFIKCDVEGSELEVIRGGLELIRAHRPGWLIEVGRATSRDVFDLMTNLGYRSFVYADTLVPTAGYRDKEFSNYFFLHPKSAMWAHLVPHVTGMTSAECVS